MTEVTTALRVATARDDLEPWECLLAERFVVLPTTTAAAVAEPRPGEDLADHLSLIGPRPRGGAWLIDALDHSGLTGCGGGHFPVARKWRSALGSDGPVTVVANGAESEPLSAKDATLLQQRPHLVLDGLACAAETLGADRAVVWLHGDDHRTRRAVDRALEERAAAGIDGTPMTVVAAPGRYLSGESSAIVRGLTDGHVLPTFRSVDRSRRSPGRRKVIVQNVETLARVALAARGSGAAGAGSSAAPATTLLTVVTAGGRVVLEVDRTTPLREAVDRAAGRGAAAPVAVLLGGFGGSWARWDDVAVTAANEQAVRALGATLGAGIVAPVDRAACGVAETAAIAQYLARSSAGQCGPCVHGLAATADSLELLRRGSAPRGELRRLRGDLEAIRGRGGCHHPDGAVRMILSALDVFSGDVERHAAGRPCSYADRTTLPVLGVV